LLKKLARYVRDKVRPLFCYLQDKLKITAVRNLFRFVEIKKSEVFGLVMFAVIFTVFEGMGVTFLLPILQYAESGGSAVENSSGFIWETIADILALVNLEPTLIVLLIMAFIPILLRNVLFYMRAWYSSVVSSRIMLRLRMKVADVIYASDPEFFTRHPVGELYGVVMSKTSTAGGAVLAIINLLGIGLLLVMYTAILLLLSVPLTLVALGFALVVSLVNKRVLKWIAANSLKTARLSQKLTAKIVERMGQMQLVKLRHTEKEEVENIRYTSETMRMLGIKAAKVGAGVEIIVDPIMMLSVFVTLYIAIAVLGSTLAQLTLVIFILTRLNGRVREFNGALQGITSATAGVKLVNEMFEASQEANVIVSGPREFTGAQESIEFRNVAFDYPDVYSAKGALVSVGRPVIADFNATIKAGSFTALVGRSGAGKSTLVELIPRMREATAGEILYDGVSIKEFQVGSLRRGIGYVTQTPMLFNNTVYENLTYGLDREPAGHEVYDALEKAHATFVYDLPKGLETKIGDRGVRFSGGERQRIAMARVLLADPDVFVFDEPTSALDSESEGYIQQTLNALHGQKTLIVIAHRLATVVAADQLLVVDKGKVVERGTHTDLIAQDGVYADLFQSQLLGFDGDESGQKESSA